MNSFYFSFVDTKREKDEFLGACFVQSTDLKSALILTHTLGINPGGECMSIQLDFFVKSQWRNKLIKDKELLIDIHKRDICDEKILLFKRNNKNNTPR